MGFFLGPPIGSVLHAFGTAHVAYIMPFAVLSVLLFAQTIVFLYGMCPAMRGCGVYVRLEQFRYTPLVWSVAGISRFLPPGLVPHRYNESIMKHDRSGL